MSAYCSVCHTTTYITMQPPLPGTVWKAEVEKMIKVYGAAIPPDAEAKILAYLQSHYTPETRRHQAAPVVAVGENSYMQTCVACHGDNGAGVPPFFPPLSKRAAALRPCREGGST